MRPLRWWVESAPPGGDRVKVSENLGATSVAPVAPVDTSLHHIYYAMPNICLLHVLKLYVFVMTQNKFQFQVALKIPYLNYVLK